MSESPDGNYTDEDRSTRFLHSHNAAVIGGPASRNRHTTPFRDQSLGGKLVQIAMFGLIVTFNLVLGWGMGRISGFW